MREQIWSNYDRELRYFRRMASEFATHNKAESKLLGLDVDKCTDTHVERMIQAFALLATRVRTKIDDDFPELTDALFSVLYPHYLAPLPSMGIVQFEPPPSAMNLAEGMKVNVGSQLQAQEVDNVECIYRTVYPVTAWPIQVVEANIRTPAFPRAWKAMDTFEAKSILQLKFKLMGGMKFQDLQMDSLRLFLWGDSIITSTLYELLQNHVCHPRMHNSLEGISFRNVSDPQAVPVALLDNQACLTPVGFGENEGILPYTEHSFVGYRLLTEFFAYREKFLFLDLQGWKQARKAGVLAGSEVEVLIYLDRTLPNNIEQDINAKTFRLGATPIVNLFEMIPDAIELTRQRFDYPIRLPEGHEIVQIKDVLYTDPTQGETRHYHPFYSYRHGDRDHHRAYWYARRRPSLTEADRGTHVDIHFCDLHFNPKNPVDPKVTLNAVCCNRDVPATLRQFSDQLTLVPQRFTADVKCLRPVTETLRPYSGGNEKRTGNATYWRLLSHLNLNYLSLSGPNNQGRAALCEYLALYDFGDSASSSTVSLNQEVINGILSIRSDRMVELLRPTEMDGGFARGLKITLELDEDKFVGIGSFLFASVLDHFLGLYTSVNSFTKLEHRSRQSGATIKSWPVRSGVQYLL